MDNREYFSAIFKEYSDETKAPNSKAHLVDIRSREGGVVTKQITFSEDISSLMPKTKPGGYVSFLADIEFKNVKFLPIYDLGGVSL